MTVAQINSDSVVRCSPKAVATEVNGEVVLMNLDRDRCYGLGITGSEIWRSLREPIKVAQLQAQLEASFTAEPGQIGADLLRTLNQFASEGLIEIQP